MENRTWDADRIIPYQLVPSGNWILWRVVSLLSIQVTQSDESVGRDAYKQLCEGLDEAQRQPKEECQLRQVSSLLLFVHEGHWRRYLTETRMCVCAQGAQSNSDMLPSWCFHWSKLTYDKTEESVWIEKHVRVCVLVHVCECADVQEEECYQIKLVKHFFSQLLNISFLPRRHAGNWKWWWRRQRTGERWAARLRASGQHKLFPCRFRSVPSSRNGSSSKT